MNLNKHCRPCPRAERIVPVTVLQSRDLIWGLIFAASTVKRALIMKRRVPSWARIIHSGMNSRHDSRLIVSQSINDHEPTGRHHTLVNVSIHSGLSNTADPRITKH